MTAGEKRKFYRNMEFERSSRQLAVAGLNLLALCGPLAIVACVLMVVFMLCGHNHSGGLSFAMAGLTARPSIDRFSTEGARRFLKNRNRSESIFHRMGFTHDPRTRNPNLQGVVEAITASLYDQVTFAQAAAFTRTLLFQTPKGQSGKTLAQTNMTFPGVLPNPYRFTIYALAIHVSNNTAPVDVQNILQNVTFELDINTKPYEQGPVALFPAGRGWIQNSAAALGILPAGTVSAFSTSNGLTDPRAVYTLDIPLTIEQGEQFQVVLNPETAFNMSVTASNPVGVGTVITVYLDGNLERGVS